MAPHKGRKVLMDQSYSFLFHLIHIRKHWRHWNKHTRLISFQGNAITTGDYLPIGIYAPLSLTRLFYNSAEIKVNLQKTGSNANMSINIQINSVQYRVD